MLATGIVDMLPILAANHAVTRREPVLSNALSSWSHFASNTDNVLTKMWLLFQEDGQASDPCITNFTPMQF